MVTPNTNPFVGSIKLVEDEFQGIPIIVVGNPSNEYIVAFERTLSDGTLLEFEPKQQDMPAILKDQEGNVWDIHGFAIEGPRRGEQLIRTNSYLGFWFAFGTMYPGVELYNGPEYTGDYQQPGPEDQWGIPTTTVFTILGPDGIPAIDNPIFVTYDEKDFIDNGFFLEDDELVVGVTINGTTHIYPHSILNWHEIVNDQIDDVYFSLSFCPLTGTAIMWDRSINGNVSTFGVSGLLYNANVMPYDRSTNSIWSQMRQDCVNGDYLGTKMESNNSSVIETTWGTWKKINKSPEVLTTDTGFSKNYDVNPYQGYLTNETALSYPVEYHDERLPNKARVFGVVIDGKAKVYQFKDFTE